MQCRKLQAVMRLLLLVVPALVCGWRQARDGRDGVHDPLPLGPAVINRAKKELAIAEAAGAETRKDLGELQVYQESAKTNAYVDQAKQDFEIARTSVTDTRIAMEDSRVQRRKADETAVATAATLAQAQKIASAAAQAAGQVVMDQIRSEARDNAVASAKDAHDNFAARKDAKAAAAAAGAMVPYHLAMMRAQKASATFYEKAKSAMGAAKSLNEKANKMAADAQALQGAGHIYEARQMMMMAHGAMGGVVNLINWANKMYGYASNINPAPYVLYEQMAAANAAYYTISNPPMAFPGAAMLQTNSTEVLTAPVSLVAPVSNKQTQKTLLQKGRALSVA